MNISEGTTYESVGALLRILGHPVRIRIIEKIGNGEACVCHLIAQLDIRQAYLSQQLMALREAGILQTSREGRFIYYSVTDRKILDLILEAAEILEIELNSRNGIKKSCGCPKCSE